MQEACIPFYPLGRPRSTDFERHLTEILVYAGLDLARTIEPSLTLDEHRKGTRPSNAALLKRFTDRALRRVGELAGRTKVMLLLPWQADAEPSLRQSLADLSRRVPKIDLDMGARHVVFIEDLLSDGDFARKNGHCDEVWGTSYGTFFLLRWPTTDSAQAVGHRLRLFLAARGSAGSTIPPPVDQEIHQRPTIRPTPTAAPPTSGIEARPRRRDSMAHFRAAIDILAPFSESAPPDAERKKKL